VTRHRVGIAPEDQEAVFEEFRQVGTADKKGRGHWARAGPLPESSLSSTAVGSGSRAISRLLMGAGCRRIMIARRFSLPTSLWTQIRPPWSS